jgi:hypothetical protein
MATSLLDWISNLLNDSDARDAFDNDPRGYASEHGFHNLSGGDVHDALSLLADNDSYSNHGGHHYPAPHDWDHNDHDGGAHYLRSYISNNHESFDRGDTNIDNSVHQDIDTGGGRGGGWDRDDDRHDGRDHDGRDSDRNDDRNDRDDRFDHDRGHNGGDFHQVIDNDPVVASGHGSVASGGDIRDSTITSGHGNVVGDHNQAVTGDHNTTAFGSGDATNANLGHTNVGDGGAISIGGDAHGSNTDNDTNTSVHNSGSGSTSVNVAGDHGDANQYADQHESDNSTHSNYEDDSRTDSHNDYNSHNSSDFDDSHDVDVHH